MKCIPCKCEMMCIEASGGVYKFTCLSCLTVATSTNPEDRPKVEPTPKGEILRQLSRMDRAERINTLRSILKAEEARK